MEEPGNPHWLDGHSNLSKPILKKAWLWKGSRQGDMCSTRKYNLKKNLKRATGLNYVLERGKNKNRIHLWT